MTTAHQRPLHERSKSSGTMKIVGAFRRGSVPVSDGNSPPPSRRASVMEPERRSSLTTIPSMLRRKKTQRLNEWNEEDEQAASQLGEMFFSLPSEILTVIISYLNIQDVYHLRQASKATFTILDHNASTITRSMLHDVVPEECLSQILMLYPVPYPCQSTAHLLQVSHRQRIIDRTIGITLSFIQMRVYMLTPQFRNAGSQFSSSRQKLITALQKPAWTVYHFLESFRKILFSAHDTEHDASVGKFWSCHLCKDATNDLINAYPVQDLLGAYHFYQLLLVHLRAATRAPTYAGTIERKLRGWGKNPASDEDLSVVIVLGGLELLSRISMMAGSYDTRLRTVSTFVDKIKYHVDVNTNLRGPDYNSLQTNDKPGSENKDLFTSLGPPFEIIRQDHLDRVPSLNEFFLPLWEERILREGLAASENDLPGPFQWVQKIIYEDEEESAVTPEAQPMGHTLYHGAHYGAPPV